MRRPVVGIVGNLYLVRDEFPVHETATMNSEAVARISGATPLMLPPDPELVSIKDIVEACDGFLLTGGPSNIHPEEYGEAPTEAHGSFDRGRDRIALPLIRSCVERGQPILGLCRGFQEFNVAFGGTLHPEIRELPGRMNHRMPKEGSLDEKFAARHKVVFEEGGEFARIFGSGFVIANSLHGQGIKSKGGRIRIEGSAEDGTPEALRVAGAKGFALAVQWHPEYKASANPDSAALFAAFGQALASWRHSKPAA